MIQRQGLIRQSPRPLRPPRSDVVEDRLGQGQVLLRKTRSSRPLGHIHTSLLHTKVCQARTSIVLSGYISISHSDYTGEYYPDQDEDVPMSPQATNGDMDDSLSRDGLPETNGRKKRKTVATVIAAEDQEYQPPGTKRVRAHNLPFMSFAHYFQRTPRRNPPRGKQQDSRVHSALDTPEVEPPPEDYHHEPTEDERRAISSDLEDCPEIWQGELGSYILETRKRQKHIDAHFNRWIIVRYISAFLL